MQIIERDELKSDPVFNKLFQFILKNHVVPDHTMRNLTENKNIKGFCEIAIHYAVMFPDLFLSYQVASWLEKDRVLLKVEKLTIYDDQTEYMIARARGFSKDMSGFAERN